MSTGIAEAPAVADGPAVTAVPRFGRLCAAELRRLFARRLLRALAAAALLGYVVAVAVVFLTHARVTPGDRAQAIAQRDQQISRIQDSIAACSRGLAPAAAAAQCGTAPTPEQFPPDQFLRNHPVTPDQVSAGALAVGAAAALLAFVAGATFIGAEWSSGNLIAWLFWEPRRLRLLTAKLIAVLAATLAVSALAEALWLAAGHLLLTHRGLPVSTLRAAGGHYWTQLAQKQARVILLTVPCALLGFGLANLIRSTAAALGAGFLYFAVLETAVRGINPDWQPYLLTTAIGSWSNRGGLTVYGRDSYNPELGYVTARAIHLSNLHGGITLLVYAALITALSLAAFHRRDIT